jgi:hypothetical protein
VFNLKQSMKKLEPHGMELLEQVTTFIVSYPTTSVADPGSGAFLTPGSGIQDKFLPNTGTWILDTGQDPIFLRGGTVTMFWVKNIKFFINWLLYRTCSKSK